MGQAYGYKGFCKVATHLLPYTRETLTERHKILRDEGIHGGGAAAENASFYSEILAANGPIEYEGDIESYMYGASGAYASAITSLVSKATAADEREAGYTGGEIIVNPGTTQAWEYPGSSADVGNKAVVSSIRMSGSAGDLIKFTASIWSTTRKSNATAPAATDYVYESEAGTEDYNPLPWYGCDVTPSIDGGTFTDRITAWDLSIENNPLRINTFNGTQYAQDIGMGMMIVTGSFTYYGPLGAFGNAAALINGGTITFDFQSAFSLYLPYILLEERGIESAGPNEIVQRTVKFRSLAKSGTVPSIAIT